MTERQDYIKCISDTQGDNKGKTWCGRRICMEWAFVDIDHAAMSGRSGDRLVACPECTAEIIKGLTAGQDE